MNKQHSPLLKKDATQSILASILSIIIGLMVGCIIILIHHQTQIGHHVLNFSTREKRRSTRNFVWNTVLHQHFFQ